MSGLVTSVLFAL